jgi:predicted acylesterase/phospholipase RssA/CRP-like cAMP-binding protein
LRLFADGRLDVALCKDSRLDRTLPFQELRRMAIFNEIVNCAPENGFGDHICRQQGRRLMGDDIIALLKVHEYFRGVQDEALQEVVRYAQVTHHPAASVVHEANALLTTVGFVLRGRLKAVRVDIHGAESFFRMIERGEQFGMMVGALAEPVPVRILSLEPTTLLSLDYEQAMELMFTLPDLRRLWLQTYARSLRKEFLGAAPKRAPMMLALIHESPATRKTAERLIDRLREVGENLAVVSDSDEWRGFPNVRFQAFHDNGRELGPEEIRRQVTEWQDANRVIFDVRADLKPQRVVQLMGLVDRAVYFVPAAASDVAMRRVQALDVPARGWRDKFSIAWLLESGSHVAPAVPKLCDFACRDYKIAATPPQWPRGRSLTGGLERLVHDLRGVRIGVALGGGVARGMAHLGVLKALEQSGIVVDMIAGTSSGAMTGVVYASGFDCDYSANQFSIDLRPSWIFRGLPRSNNWFLLYKFRRGQFDPMLRKYLHDWKLEQLAIPCVSVAVDLVSGQLVVRERGDAVHAVLESINLPVFSVPICRNHEALIDGGLVNNLPADVLVSMGCNLVIAVSVTAKIEKQFCNITPETPRPPRKKPTIVQTVLRSLLVQNHNLNAHGVRPADVVIEPDLTGFDLTEFVRAKELAAIGEAAALEQIPKIQQLLTRLDPQLFRPSGGAAYLQMS